MGLPRRPAPGPASPRLRAERLTERVEALPRPPFTVAAAAAVALLLAALAAASDPGRVATGLAMFGEAAGETIGETVGEVAILEYGFGLVEWHGRERLTVGAVVHNPHPTASAAVSFEITAALGEPALERFRISLPPGEALVGRMLTDVAADRADDELALVLVSAPFEAPSEAEPSGHLPSRFTVLATEPLISPHGHRIVYQVDSELDRAESTRPDVVFRDAEGRIVGGVGGRDHVAEGPDSGNMIEVPPGVSTHHFHLRSEEIPEGADLSKTEIGPGGLIPGG